MRRLSWSQMVLVTWVPPLRVNTWVALRGSFHFTEPHLFNRNSTTYCLGSPKDSLDHVKIQKHNRCSVYSESVSHSVVSICNQLCPSATPWTVAHQAPQSMGFPRQEYWSGLPFPSPGDLPSPRTEPRSHGLQMDPLPSEPPQKLKTQVGGLLTLLQHKATELKADEGDIEPPEAERDVSSESLWSLRCPPWASTLENWYSDNKFPDRWQV